MKFVFNAEGAKVQQLADFILEYIALKSPLRKVGVII